MGIDKHDTNNIINAKVNFVMAERVEMKLRIYTVPGITTYLYVTFIRDTYHVSGAAGGY